MPIEYKQVFYAALPVLHGVGAILAVSLSFVCGSGNAKQTGLIPSTISLQGLTGDTGFYAAYPWDEGGELAGQNWNPFALIFVFEWLTAGFALRPLRYFTDKPDHLLAIWVAWLVVGLGVFMAWTFTNSGGICPAMFASVLASFVASAGLAYVTLRPPPALASLLAAKPRFKKLESEDYHDHHGRTWKVPSCVQGLRARRSLSAPEDEPVSGTWVDDEFENNLGVVYRYAEYCITAPLLFIAVVCLMVVDAPAWLFLTGYWFVFVCNAIGITLHVDFTTFAPPAKHHESGGIPSWFARMSFPGPW